ncbi:hypothetical protein EHS39_28415 [Ensifer sp. MPMI2T]|nr:hypothetical protein EHS39_28415 [Ensifer sp. MPMI2T]
MISAVDSRFAVPAKSKSQVWQRIEFLIVGAAIFFSPVNVLRLNQFYFTFSDALFSLALILSLINGRIPLRPLGRVSTVVWLSGLCCIVFGLLISSLVSPDPIRGLVVPGQYIFAYFVVLLIVAGRPVDETIKLAKLYILSVFLMCLHAIYLIHWDGQKNTTFVSGSGRFTGFVERENECAALIALAVPILLLVAATGRLRKIYVVIAVPVMGYGIMLTGSNSGLACLAYGLIVFLLVTASWKRLLAGAGVALAAAAVMANAGRAYLPAIFQKRVLGALESGDLSQAGTFDHRLELIHEAMDLVESNFWVGLGADQYMVVSYIGRPVHNVYLLLWNEGGIVAVCGFLLMLLAGLGPIARAFKLPGGLPFAACGFVCLSMFLLAVNAFTHVYGRFWSVPIILSITLAQAYCRSWQRQFSQPRFFGPERR